MAIGRRKFLKNSIVLGFVNFLSACVSPNGYGGWSDIGFRGTPLTGTSGAEASEARRVFETVLGGEALMNQAQEVTLKNVRAAMAKWEAFRPKIKGRNLLTLDDTIDLGAAVAPILVLADRFYAVRDGIRGR